MPRNVKLSTQNSRNEKMKQHFDMQIGSKIGFIMPTSLAPKLALLLYTEAHEDYIYSSTCLYCSEGALLYIFASPYASKLSGVCVVGGKVKTRK